MPTLEKIAVLDSSATKNSGRIVFVYNERPNRIKRPSQIIATLRDTAKRRLTKLAHAPTDFLARRVVRRDRRKVYKEDGSYLLLHEHLFGIAGYDGGGHRGQILIHGTDGGVCVLEYTNLVEAEWWLLIGAIEYVGWRIIDRDLLTEDADVGTP